MPFASPGAVTLLLAQAPALCGSAPLPATVSPPEVAIVQRDDAFVIVSGSKPVSATSLESLPARPVSITIGRTVVIDPKLLVAGMRRATGASR